VAFSLLPQIKDSVKRENMAIEAYFEKFKKIKDDIITYNNNLIKTVDAYKIVQNQLNESIQVEVKIDESKDTECLRKTMSQMRNVKSKIQKDLAIVMNNVFSAKELEKIITLKPTLNQSIKKKNDDMNKITQI